MGPQTQSWTRVPKFPEAHGLWVVCRASGRSRAPGLYQADQEVEDALSVTDWPPGPQRGCCCKGPKWHHRGEGWTWDEAVSPGVRGQGPQNYAEHKLGGRVPASLRWKRRAVRRDGSGLSAELRPRGRTRWAGGRPACGRPGQAMGSRVSLPPRDLSGSWQLRGWS